MMIKNKQGYTLIELMIGVAVIGIIAVVAIPSYRQYVTNSEVSACARYIMPSRLIATNLIMSNNSSVPPALNEADLGLVNGPCTSVNVDVSGQVLTITGGAGGEIFQIQRSAVGGTWSCGIVGNLANTNCNDFN
jgi:type IV pilus assembly protein PilA